MDRTGQTDTIDTIHIDTDYRVLQKTHTNHIISLSCAIILFWEHCTMLHRFGDTAA